MVAAHALPGIGSRRLLARDEAGGSGPLGASIPRREPRPLGGRAATARPSRGSSTRTSARSTACASGSSRIPEEARDAAQEAFTRAFASLESYDLEQAFAPWVLRIARNHCLDLLRRRIPARARVELDADDEDGPPRELPDTTSERADDAIEKAQTREALEKAVAALPPNYREVVHLFHVEQLSYKEIASTMGIPLGTVMTWLHRARAQLRNLLEGQEVSP